MIITLAVILAIAVVMTMTGRGGGNFYVVALVLTGMSMHQAAATGQFILMLTAFAGMLIFHKRKMVDWKLALVIDPPTDVMAFIGGYFSEYVGGTPLKLAFSVLMVFAGFVMLKEVKEKPIEQKKRFGYWHRQNGENSYTVNLWLAIPITAAVGLVSGALGISGGSFKVPLMVLLCGVPMNIAVGTSSAMVAVTALMGFIGHSVNGHFIAEQAIPLALVAVIGGVCGGKLAVKTDKKKLKKMFAWTTLAAALFMAANAVLTN